MSGSSNFPSPSWSWCCERPLLPCAPTVGWCLSPGPEAKAKLPWPESADPMSQSKSSLLTAWLSLAFCHSAWKLTPTDFLMAVYSLGSFTGKIRQSAVCHTTVWWSIRVMLSWPLPAYWYTSKMPSKASSMCWLMKATRGLESRMGITCFHSLHVLLVPTLLWGKDRVARGNTYPSEKKISLDSLGEFTAHGAIFPPWF